MRIPALIDHTLLKPEATHDQIASSGALSTVPLASVTSTTSACRSWSSAVAPDGYPSNLRRGTGFYQ
jgi:hypothetical protein